MMNSKNALVWLKRDLRLRDHGPLAHAFENYENVYVIYIFEPLISEYPDFDIRHWRFVYESLKEMQISLPITIMYGDALKVFENILSELNHFDLLSYQETGLEHTFERDLTLKHFFKSRSIQWREYQRDGIVRGLKNRKNWDQMWLKVMKSQIHAIPNQDVIHHKAQVIHLENNDKIPVDLEKTLNSPDKMMLHGGHHHAHQLLQNFLDKKVQDYFKMISYPEKSRYYCSLLSAYISWGCISIREIYQECENQKPKITNKTSLNQFMSRLKWHCHFIQKLEMQTNIESKNLNKSYDQIRKKKNKKYIKAWKDGMSGIPIIDACMRCVNETGYLNFRMRAMVVSFLTHHLWQPWQSGTYYLARCFLDYEPGIHFSQFQMQAGTTGVNTIRIYNPIKQSYEKDKEASFIRKWVPELRNLPDEYIHEPWKMTEMEQIFYQFTLDKDYPRPIVDIESSAEYARKELWAVRKSESCLRESRKILNVHVRGRKNRFNNKTRR